MRCLLINPWAAEVFPPPSLGYLQATLKRETDWEVIAKDLPDINEADVATKWDLVAASFHSFSIQNAAKVRSMFYGTHLVCGGHHPSALPQQMFDLGYDQVVIGEGEAAIVRIINGDRSNLIMGESTPIDQIPWPDYTGFGSTGAMGLPVISSRGCVYDCSFCASSQFWHRRCTMRTADNVLAEIEGRAVKLFMFEDDNFTVNRHRVIEICDGLRRMGGMQWQCASRAETLADDELCWNLRAAGCHTVWLGVESFSQPALDRNRKRTTVEKMLAGIKIAHAAGLETMSQFIVGLPDDSEADIDETARVIRQNNIGRKGTNILWVLPQTEAYLRAKLHGFDDSAYLYKGAPYYTVEQDFSTLTKWNNKINMA
jgi:radical SAM superfamily enzyme YgiQ (UPF0313 family)